MIGFQKTGQTSSRKYVVKYLLKRLLNVKKPNFVK